MKTAFLPSFDICNIHDRKLTVDLLLIEARNGNREVFFYLPGTTEHADEIPTQIDEFEFETEEIDAWWEHAAPYMKESQCVCESCTTDPGGNCVNCGLPAGPVTNLDKLLELVANLVRADEQREDTSFAARAIREYFVDTLKRPDPLGLIPSDMPSQNEVVLLGDFVGDWPCGQDNEGHEAEYAYKGHNYIIGHDDSGSWFYRKDDTDEKNLARLEYLRGELRAERISCEELVELQDLIPWISKDDTELLEAAGVPENKESKET